MSEAYDRNRLIELFGDDAIALAEIEREFLDTAQAARSEICETEDLETIARAAHRLRGASGMVGAVPLGRIAEAVERAAAAGDLPRVRGLDVAFAQEVTRVALQVGAAQAGVAQVRGRSITVAE